MHHQLKWNFSFSSLNVSLDWFVLPKLGAMQKQVNQLNASKKQQTKKKSCNRAFIRGNMVLHKVLGTIILHKLGIIQIHLL